MSSKPNIIWWRKSDQDTADHLDQYLDAIFDREDATPLEAGVAIFSLQGGTKIALTMKEMGDLKRHHDEFLSHPLILASERAWRQRESEVALLGARRLEQAYNIPLDEAFMPSVLDEHGQKDYQQAMRALRGGAPKP